MMAGKNGRRRTGTDSKTPDFCPYPWGLEIISSRLSPLNPRPSFWLQASGVVRLEGIRGRYILGRSQTSCFVQFVLESHFHFHMFATGIMSHCTILWPERRGKKLDWAWIIDNIVFSLKSILIVRPKKGPNTRLPFFSWGDVTGTCLIIMIYSPTGRFLEQGGFANGNNEVIQGPFRYKLCEDHSATVKSVDLRPKWALDFIDTTVRLSAVLTN